MNFKSYLDGTMLLVSLVFFSCNDRSTTSAVIKDSPVYYPFAPIYSNDFEKGREQHARAVLQVWRQFETGDVRKEKENFSDSIKLILPDKILHGDKEQVLEQYYKRRNDYSNMQCFIYSWMPVHVKDEGDDMVWVWGLYDGTRHNGDRDYALVHEVWRFDKKGRIREMEQFRTHPH